MYVLSIDRMREDDSDRSLLCRLSLKVFSDEKGAMWKKNVKDIEGDVLCVSQFTLYANTSKGSKPDFHRAMVSNSRAQSLRTVAPLRLVTSSNSQGSERSREMYNVFLDRMRSLYSAEKIQGLSCLSQLLGGPPTFRPAVQLADGFRIARSRRTFWRNDERQPHQRST